MMTLLGSKKGQISNYAIVIIALFVLGIFSLIGAVLMYNMIDAFTTAGVYNGVVETTGNTFFQSIILYDYLIIIIMVLLIISVGLTSFKLNAAPAFFIVTLFMGAFLGVVSYFFNYIFAQFMSQDAFATILVYFPRTMILCTNLHWVSLITIVVGSITLYAKKDRGEFVR